MLIIREEQMSVFEQVSFRRFEDSMVVHIKTFFPNHFTIAKEPVIRDVIRYGIERAEAYDFATERVSTLLKFS